VFKFGSHFLVRRSTFIVRGSGGCGSGFERSPDGRRHTARRTEPRSEPRTWTRTEKREPRSV